MDARKHFLVVLLSVMAFLATVDAVCNFNEPLGDPYPDEDFVKVEYNKDAYITQIELDENYPNATQKNVRIAVFNCDESDVPTIGQFSLGSQMSLGLETEKNDNKWYLIVTNAQDYENPSQRDYVFVVRAGVEQLDVALSIRNLDDESPYFLPVNTSCEIKETQIGQSSCFLLVNDPDAIMDNMKFRVLDGGNLSENISLVVVNDVDFCKPAVPKDCLTVALYIKAELEFINKPVYSLLLEVEDQAGHIGNLPYIVQVIAENKDTPHFTPQQLIIELDEETPGIIFTKEAITVSDRDALDFGQFYLTLGGDGSDECYKAFDVIPRAGYRYTEVKLSVIDPKMLDYDEGSCNNIIVKIIATEITDATRTGEAEVNVQLIDLNDEPPIFEEKEYVFSAEKHTAIGTHLGFVKANDRDAFDIITYSLASTAYLNVDPETGSVTVNADFNYHRQPQVFATVRADDTARPPHFDLAQITVNVIDINNLRPVLNMPCCPANIDEVADIDTVLNFNITASDEDTDPDLSFSIDWENSRAAKQGFPVKKEDFEDCLRIETFEDPDDPLARVAVLKVNRIIHWEVFDTLFVNIVVEDRNTHPDYQQNRNTSAMLTVIINDINDCYPQFNEIGKLTFKENTKEGQLFGIITATDQDGPGFNEVKYYLINDLYKEEYVTIHSISGEMRTGKDPVDFEQIEVLYYTVVATDGELETPINISIEIEDVNDNTPYFLGYNIYIYVIPENFTERMKILQFQAQDNDTSPQFHTLTFFVEAKYKGLFEVDSVTGEVYVPEGAGGSLDYEGVNTYSIEYTVRDRCEEGFCYPDSLSSSRIISVELLDINDNPPVIQNGGKLAAIGEDGAPGVQLGYVIATDEDSYGNANLTFEFVGFEPERGQELFAITKVDMKRASITVKNNMLDKWGNYTLTVMASDGLFEDTADFIIEVIDINNNQPVFVFPNETTVLRFNILGNIPGTVLSDVNGNKMVFSAIDDKDNGFNGTAGMAYSLIGDDIATKYLRMLGNELWLIRDFDADMSTNFKLQLKACDGEFPSAQQCTVIETEVRLRMDREYEPTFDVHEWETSFTENKTGLNEVRKIDVPVTDLNNGDCEITEDDCELDKIYYFIYVGDQDTFHLDAEYGTLSLKKELDREGVDKHYLVVVVTSSMNGPPTTPEENSTLKVTIKVIDIIDTAPEFNKSVFAAGITVGDKVNDVVTTLSATSYDLNDKLTYSIIDKSMNVTDVSLQHLVGKNPFKINDDQLQLNFDVQDSSMKGMFFFKVLVTNLGDLTDEAVCQVYVISEDYLVPMRFKNNVSFVESKSKQIAVIYSDISKYQSNVKRVARSVDSNGTPLDDLTDVTSNFVDAEEVKPIPKEEITKQLTDPQIYNELRYALLKEQLELDSIVNDRMGRLDMKMAAIRNDDVRKK